MKKKFFWEIFAHYSLILLIAFGFLLSVESFTINTLLYDHTEQELLNLAEILKHGLLSGDSFNHTRIRELCTAAGKVKRIRITIIDDKGVVIGDSENDPGLMENHAARPEIHQSLLGKTGTAVRHSSTLEEKVFYLAIPLISGDQVRGVLRISRSVKYIDVLRNNFIFKSLTAALVVFVLALISSIMVARKIDGPVLKLEKAARDYAVGNFDLKINIQKPEELRVLGQAMNSMAEQLSDRINTINNQKHQQEAILANMVEPVLLLDEDLIITRANKAATELFTMSMERPGYRTLIEAIRNVELYDLARQALSDRRFTEKTIILKREAEIHLQVHATPLLNDQGLCSGLLLVMNNISRLIRLENIRKDFVANVSHELKTPITAIQGFLEILGSGSLSNTQKKDEYWDIIVKQTGRMSSIIDDLLQLSGLESGELKPTVKEACRLGELLENARKNCLLAAQKKNMDIKMSGEESLRILVNGFLLEQAVTNLVDNAVKYSPEGRSVDIVYGGIPGREGWVELTVSDHGLGIPPSDLPHIFERFYRVDKARSRSLGGTGLGLAIVKHIVQSHNGEITVESRLGEGSSFTIRLPGLIV